MIQLVNIHNKELAATITSDDAAVLAQGLVFLTMEQISIRIDAFAIVSDTSGEVSNEERKIALDVLDNVDATIKQYEGILEKIRNTVVDNDAVVFQMPLLACAAMMLANKPE